MVSSHLLTTVTFTTPFADEWPRFCQARSILAHVRGMLLWCVRKEKATSSAFILLFAAISYSLQSCSLIFLYTIWNWIHIHAWRRWIYCFQPSTNLSKGSNCSNAYFKHVPSLFFIWSCTLLGCVKVSFPVTDITGNRKFICKTHSSFLIVYKVNCWLMTLWT